MPSGRPLPNVIWTPDNVFVIKNTEACNAISVCTHIMDTLRAGHATAWRRGLKGRGLKGRSLKCVMNKGNVSVMKMDNVRAG